LWTAPAGAGPRDAAGSKAWSLSLYYSWTGDAGSGGGSGAIVPGELIWRSGPAAAALDFYPKALEHRPLVFNSERWGEPPEEITIQTGPGFEPREVKLEYRREDPLVPLSADLGTMMYYPPSAWRNEDYEIFSFTLYPRIFYLITGSFEIQSRFLKRLAFFTEKPGFAGKLARDEEIETLRDWFAHDYRAGDIARFYELARERNFPLNPSEVLLRTMLLGHGIIRSEGGRYTEGEGALVGLSVESRNRLPVYYIHETIHGLEFTMPELGRLFLEFFHGLSGMEKVFIRDALAYRGYNVLEDERLLASEMASYLLQQRAEETDRYYREYIVPWYAAYHGGAAAGGDDEAYSDGVTVFLAENPGIFGRRGASLGDRFFDLTGLRAETFYDLLPKNREL
jgi:hypothetical protein